MITTSLDVAEILKGMNMEQQLKCVMDKLSDRIGIVCIIFPCAHDSIHCIVYKIDLTALPYAEGASWNPSRVCLDLTRTALLDDIWHWINMADASKTAEILWLTGVTGAGKSAVAHTVAKRCYDQGLLASSFFFDRETAGRNGPQKLFSTIARDLANLNVDLGEQISLAIERDQSITTAAPSRQFKELILDLSRWHPIRRPVVIVIDALDEGYDVDMLQILQYEVPKLPGTFRIFVTSRTDKAIVVSLSKQPHVQPRVIDIHEQTNLEDTAVYVKYKLGEVAKWGEMGNDWPGQSLTNELTKRAEGLFIWVATVCDYLCHIIDPTEQLESLVSNHSPTGCPAEAKMDELYLAILKTCNWDDEAFVKGYHMLVGAIMAAKTPLSAPALQSLHRASLLLPVRKVLRSLSPLLAGLTDHTQPVRILHLSFREFLTVRARIFPDRVKFYLDEVEHSQRLAFLCLAILNQDLKPGMAGTGYMDAAASELRKIPVIGDGHISEELWYACQFWIDHIVDVEVPATDLVNMLQKFLTTQVVLWMEIMTSKGRFRKLLEVRKWLQVCKMQAHSIDDLTSFPSLQRAFPEDHDLINAACSDDLARIFNEFCICLSFGRRDEALMAVEEAVELRRQHAADSPNTYSPDLAISLNNLASRLTDLGHREEALHAAEEAVKLWRQLAENDSTIANPGLAASLSNLANCLSRLGFRKEALRAIDEAVEVYRPFAVDNSTLYNGDLAFSLNYLAKCLSLVGRREDALRAVDEAVTLYRPLAQDRPRIFKPNLAYSLGNLAKCLSYLGRRQEALEAEKEAVELYRPLAADNPAKFNPNLAYSLNNFAKDLTHFGQQDNALKAVKEAVDMYQILAENHPTTFNPNLAYSLNNLAKCLIHVGRREDALQRLHEAIEIRRRLVANNPATFNRDLAISLNSVTELLSDLGHQEEALEAAQEAVQLWQQLAVDHPAATNPDLSVSLHNLSICLFNLGYQEDALHCMEETIELRQQLVAHHVRFNSDLAVSLTTFARWLLDLGCQEKARQITQEVAKLTASSVT